MLLHNEIWPYGFVQCPAPKRDVPQRIDPSVYNLYYLFVVMHGTPKDPVLLLLWWDWENSTESTGGKR